jgi:oligoendopeptidase F
MTHSTSTPIKAKYSVNWNLKLLYHSAADPQIKKDLKGYDEKRREFAEKYNKRTDFLSEEETLLDALTEYEQLLNDLGGIKPLMYFYYLTAVESGNTQAHAQFNKITTQLTKAYNQLAFFPLQIGKIDPAHQTRFLQSSALSRYHYFLKKRFELAKYDLTKEQEKILNLTDQTSYQMWVEGVEKAINQLTIPWEEKQLPIAEAAQRIAKLPTKKRRKLHQQLLRKLSKISDFAEAEINAVVTYKNISDELRGYKQPYSARILADQNDPETIHTLIEVVTQNFDLAHRFYQLKAKLLDLDELEYADRSAEINQIKKKYSFDEAIKLVGNTLQELDPQFDQIFRQMLDLGQIDVFPKKNKVNGAFCSSSTNNPTFILLNHTNDYNSVTTLAHEVGHAIHSELSKSQPVLYQSHSTSLAETASTFFEQLVSERLVKEFNQQEKIIVLHNKIQDDINTVFRQIALFNFELELHRKIKESGYLDHQQIGELLNHHMSEYLGPLFKLSQLDGNFYIVWSHIRNYFYTYAYAFGHLVSKALVQNVKNQPAYIEKVKQVLSAGCKATPREILLEAGVEVNQPEFFAQSIKAIKQNISS